jgi:hypothetical protein
VNFSEGKDGGRDGRFQGTANKYPSLKSPWSGKFIVQAKRSASPVAKCADPEFKKLLDDEFPKINRLKKEKEIDIYLIFTNRKMSAGTDAKLRKYIEDNTGLKKNTLTQRHPLWGTPGLSQRLLMVASILLPTQAFRAGD